LGARLIHTRITHITIVLTVEVVAVVAGIIRKCIASIRIYEAVAASSERAAARGVVKDTTIINIQIDISLISYSSITIGALATAVTMFFTSFQPMMRAKVVRT
jgi:hypothetical protein